LFAIDISTYVEFYMVNMNMSLLNKNIFYFCIY